MTPAAHTLPTITPVLRAEIYPSPLNPRRALRPEALERLRQDIAEHGINVPLELRHTPGDPRGEYEIIAGHRRFEASPQLAAVPAIVRTGISDQEMLRRMTIDNLEREQLHPLEETLAVHALQESGLSLDAIAAQIHRTPRFVGQRLALRALSPAAAEAFFNGDLTLGHALHLVRLSIESQDELVAAVREHGWRARELAWQIRNIYSRRLSEALFKRTDATLPGGACSVCPKRTGANPDLFEDENGALGVAGKRAEECLDRVCYDAKRAAYFERRTAAIVAAHGACTLLRGWHSRGPVPGSLTADQYREVDKDHKRAEPGLLEETGALVWFVRTAEPARPKRKANTAVDSGAAKWKASQARRLALAQAVLGAAKLGKRADRMALENLVVEVYEFAADALGDLGLDDRADANRLLGLPAFTGVRPPLEKLTLPKLEAVLVRCGVAMGLYNVTAGRHPIEAIAKAAGIRAPAAS